MLPKIAQNFLVWQIMEKIWKPMTLQRTSLRNLLIPADPVANPANHPVAVDVHL